MKELSKEQICKILTKHDQASRWVPDQIGDWVHSAFNEAYRLGQQEAAVDEQRFRAACAALTGYRSRPIPRVTEEEIAEACRRDADALLAELNRTASDAEKGGENG